MALLSVACLIAPLGLIKWIGRAGWLRTVGAWALFTVGFMCVGGLLSFVIRRSLAHPLWIPTASMSPTLVPGDRFIVDPTLRPRRWDVITFHAPFDPEQIYASRLVGLPGETIELVDGEVTVNGAVIAKPRELAWLKYADNPVTPLRRTLHGTRGSPITLGAEEFFVLGDNTTQALDSRYWDQGPTGVQLGAVPARMIVGTARFVYAPFARAKVLR